MSFPGDHKPENIAKNVSDSLAALKTKKVPYFIFESEVINDRLMYCIFTDLIERYHSKIHLLLLTRNIKRATLKRCDYPNS